MKMEKDILSFGEKPKKPREIVTLSVKDMLPDLSDALKKQGGKKIESKGRAETVYFSEGYEVKKLKFNDVLPDLSAEINKPSAYVSKPSAGYDLADNSYDVDKLNISSSLPDLTDMLANPEKYAKPEAEKVFVDEDALLKNIVNVEFKPFYDGSQEFEVLNEAPSVDDIQQEFSQFGNFEIHNDDSYEKPTTDSKYDDFESLFSEDYLDLDAKEISEEIVAFFENKETVYEGAIQLNSEEENVDKNQEESGLDLSEVVETAPVEIVEPVPVEIPVFEPDLELQTNSDDVNKSTVQNVTEEKNLTRQDSLETAIIESQQDLEPSKPTVAKPKKDFVPLKLERNVSKPTQKRETTEQSQDLMKKIEQSKLEREKIRARLAKVADQKKVEKSETKVSVTSTKCIIDGVNYNVISSVNLTHNTGCHLVKNEDGYAVLGFVGRKMTKLISYDSLKSEKIQARVNEKISDTEARYIIRIGLNKFLVKADDNNIEFVMNLC